MALEKKLALELVAMLVENFGPTSELAEEVPRWLKGLGCTNIPQRPASRNSAAWWARIRPIICRLADEEPVEDDENGAVLRNIDLLARHFGLSPVDLGIFSFIVAHERFDQFNGIVDDATRTKEVSLNSLLALSGKVRESDIREALRQTAPLLALGILKYDPDLLDRRICYRVSNRLREVLLVDATDIDDLMTRLFPAATAPEAEWQDFTVLGSQADLARRLLHGALASGLPGVNILLYGPPGTGKTEFCKVLARELKADLRAIGEVDEHGREPSRGDRMSELRLASRMFALRRETILLFDEMEDLLQDQLGSFVAFQSGHMHSSGSKVHFNRMLETNPVPVLWTTNSIEDCDPAFLRRMTFSLEMRPPTGEIRTRIWQRLDQRIAPGIDADTLREMAEANPLPPALVADAMRVARLCDGGAEVFGQVLEASARVTNGGVAPARQARPDRPWQPELAQADCDLMRIEALVSKPDAPRRLSFCLEGPPGTGKSAWARHLAKVMGLPVIEKRASDLLSMWLGGSEKNIARAFASARAEGAMLIFDEADSLLSDRRSAQQSWEVTQVNEMLTWMESHPLPFVCTTNFVERLDPATQRRFTFRIRFGWLTPAQLPLAWTVHFGTPAPRELVALDRLTPGDFANVARRMQALGETDPSTILAQLQREIEAKESTPRPIGFGR